jgi:transposase-like protein
VAKRQRRLTGVDDMVISLVAKGLTTGEVQAHLAEIYGAEVSRDTISTITDRVLEGLAEWQSRPLDAVYAVLFIDVINVKIRDGNVANRPIYVILGVTADGERDILGLRAGEHGDGEGAKFWLRVLAEVKNGGTRDVLMVVCDGLKGLPAEGLNLSPGQAVLAPMAGPGRLPVGGCQGLPRPACQTAPSTQFCGVRLHELHALSPCRSAAVRAS